jgi:hypothetical protein
MKRFAAVLIISVISGMLMISPAHVAASDKGPAQTTSNEKIIEDDTADFNTKDPGLTPSEKQTVIENDQKELELEKDSEESMDNSTNSNGF